MEESLKEFLLNKMTLKEYNKNKERLNMASK